MNSQNTSVNIYLYFLFTIFSIIFLYLFSFGTSPLYPTYGGDSEIFILVGKAITEGKLLYKDIFDHKGPILFFINALGFKLGGIKGIFILQILNLTVIQILLFKISNLFFKSIALSLIPILGMFILFASCLDDGDVSEEYSITFVLLALYLYLKYLFYYLKGEKHPLLYSFIYGISFCIVALIRLNNGVVICCIVLVLFISLLIDKKYVELFTNLISFFGGFLLFFLLTSLYFVYYDTFQDFIYATFTFNFKYSHSYPRPSLLASSELLISGITLIPILFLYASLYIERKKVPTTFIYLCILIGILSFISIRVGGGLLHYQMLNIFSFILGIILTMLIIKDKEIKRYSKSFILIFLSVVSLMFIYQARRIHWVYYLSRDKVEPYNPYGIRFDKEKVNNIIPENERNSVFGYNVRSYWFLETNILPSYKFYTNQELWVMVDRSVVYDGINNYLLTTPPKWIVLPKDHLISRMKGLKDNPILARLIETDYSMIADDFDYMYYRHK